MELPTFMAVLLHILKPQLQDKKQSAGPGLVLRSARPAAFVLYNANTFHRYHVYIPHKAITISHLLNTNVIVTELSKRSLCIHHDISYY